MAKRKKSEVWEYFIEESGTSVAACTICSTKVHRGRDDNRSSWSATPLWDHLKRYHPTVHQQAKTSRDKEASAAKRRKEESEKSKEIYVNGTPILLQFLTKKQK